MRRALSLIAVLLSGPACADDVAPADPVIADLSTARLTELPGFRGDEATLLGLHLGQSWEDARAVVEAHPGLTLQEDEANPGRFYVNLSPAPAGDPAVFYLQWPPEAEGGPPRPDLGRMVIYSTVAPFVPDARLFSATSLDTLPADLKAWLGPPDRSVVTLDIPDIGLKLTSHVFEKRALEVTDHVSSDGSKVMVALVQPELLVR